MKFWRTPNLNRRELEHVARTCLAATLSLLLARWIALREPWWAVITTMIVMQSTLGAALGVSGQRLAGTALGATAAASLATRFGEGVVVFVAGITGLGLVCALLQIGRAAYRFAGIAFVIVLLVQRGQSPWVTATHRFCDVAIGIVVGLAVTALWPESAVTAGSNAPQPTCQP